MRIVAIVFKPEAIPDLEILKLSGYDTSKRRSNNCTVYWNLRDTGCSQIYIIHVSAYTSMEFIGMDTSQSAAKCHAAFYALSYAKYSDVNYLNIFSK